MASEMAEFLWNKFLNAFKEAITESELQLGVISHFTTIKQAMESDQNRKKEMCSSADSSVLSILHRLNDAISECRVFAQQMNSLTKNSIRFNPLTEFFFVKKMKRRLVKIKADFLNLNIATQERDGGEQTSYPHHTKEGNESKIFGFDEHMVKFEEKLLENDGRFKAIGIYGMGGSGKTTLAKEIYNTERVRSEFSRRIWVSLSDTVESNEPEIGGKVVKLVLKALRYDSERLTSNTSFDDLLAILNCELKSQRYLIVLDDLWIIHEFWDSFLKALPVNPGGALIVTSRLEDLARRIVDKENLFHIPPLNKEDCWKIFEDSIYELDRSIFTNSSFLAKFEKESKELEHLILAEIEEEIKDQFHGLPLAAKTLAKIICKRIKSAAVIGKYLSKHGSSEYSKRTIALYLIDYEFDEYLRMKYGDEYLQYSVFSEFDEYLSKKYGDEYWKYSKFSIISGYFDDEFFDEYISEFDEYGYFDDDEFIIYEFYGYLRKKYGDDEFIIYEFYGYLRKKYGDEYWIDE